MKQIFRIGWLQIQSNFHSVKYWIAILLQIAHTAFYSVKIKNLSLSMGNPVNMFDGYFLSNGSGYIMTVSFLIFILMVSDIPFVNDITLEERIRTSKKRWILGKMISIPISAFIIQVIVICTSFIILSSNGFLQNIWSRPFFQITQNMANGTIRYGGIYILKLFRPFEAVIIQAVLMILFESTQAVLLYILCIKFEKIVAYSVIVVIHIAGFFMNSLNRIQLLPFPHAVMEAMYSFEGNGSNYVRAFSYYSMLLVIEFVVLDLLIKGDKTNDLV